MLLREHTSDNNEGRFLTHCLRHITRSHAQFLQDLWVSYQLAGQREGFFVEFGAYDVRLISVEHHHTDKRQPLFDLLTGKGFRRTLEKVSNVDDWYVKA